jgi:RNA-directed DNA polymerase
VTWQAYGENLDTKLKALHDRIHKGSYRARPAKRTHIPKADGSKRPLSVWCLEDKVVQQAVVTVLEAVYEEDFVGYQMLPRHARRFRGVRDQLAQHRPRVGLSGVGCGPNAHSKEAAALQ